MYTPQRRRSRDAIARGAEEDNHSIIDGRVLQTRHLLAAADRDIGQRHENPVGSRDRTESRFRLIPRKHLRNAQASKAGPVNLL